MNDLQFYEELYALKTTLRRGWQRVGVEGRAESDAEHTFSMMLAALTIMAHADTGLDQLRVLKMIAYHEMGEIDVGDITPHDGVSAADKHQRELAAIERLAAQYRLPEMLALWQEFEEAQSPEAKFVKALDKYDAFRQAQVYEHRGLAPEGTADEFYRGASALIDFITGIC